MRLIVAFAMFIALVLPGAQGIGAPGAMMSMPDEMARGKYLTSISGCYDCHGPQLKGGPLFFEPAKGVKLPGPWASVAPKIAGLPMFATDAQAVTFLRTGVMPDGSHARIPMPQYRFNDMDAKTIVVFIRKFPH